LRRRRRRRGQKRRERGRRRRRRGKRRRRGGKRRIDDKACSIIPPFLMPVYVQATASEPVTAGAASQQARRPPV
jgi:hypothetical protein